MIGVTTNPTIFAAALANGEAYDAQIKELAALDSSVDDTIKALTSDDVRNACDILAATSAATGGVDGRVSIEVEPGLAMDTEGTTAQAADLWKIVDRPNVLIKIPATKPGLPAITAVDRRGDQRERDLDLLPGPLPRGDRRVHQRSGAGGGERSRPEPDPLRGLLLRLPGGRRDRQAARRASAPTRPRPSRARPRSPTPGWPTRCTRRSSAASGSPRWRPRGPTGSGRCGPRPGSRTRRCPTPCTSPSWWWPTRSTPCRRRP